MPEWRLARIDEEAAARLAKDLNLAPLTARLLVRRGLAEPDAARSFLNPSLAELPNPDLLPDMAPAVDRIIQALDQDERIVVHGDYDADGLTATALLMDFLSGLGGKVETFVPDRLEDGYGLKPEFPASLKERGAGLLITVDCGISDFEGAASAQAVGLDLVITDHHQVGDRLPPAVAVINPHRSDSRFPQPDLAGVGVAFFLAGGVRQELKRRGIRTENGPELAPLLSLCAIGAVADVVPLTGVNRILVSQGLRHLAQPDRPGLEALKKTAALEAGRPVRAGDIAFRLAPRINAVGRLGSAEPALRLLLTRDAATAADLAGQLETANRDRRRLQEETHHQAMEMINENGGVRGRTIMLAREGWQPGVVGLAASKLAEEFHCPAVLLAVENGSARGSGRSVPGFNLYRALNRCRDIMLRFGGHEQAAGMTVAADRVEELAAAFEEAALAQTTGELAPAALVIDAVAKLAELTPRLAEELDLLAPFGQGNPAPLLAVEGVNVLTGGTMGAGHDHLKLTLEQDGAVVQAVGFGLGRVYTDLGLKVDAALRPYLSTFRGRTAWGWRMEDVRRAR